MASNPYAPPESPGMGSAAPTPEQRDYERLRTYRRYTVIAALVLLVASLMLRMPALSYARAALWATAGVLCLLEGRAATAAGYPNRMVASAIIYFLVALLPLWRRM